jgi:hypothetical protein
VKKDDDMVTMWDLDEYERMKVEVKLSLCLTKYHAIKAYWGVEV